jgi:copper chaperone
MLKEQNNMKKIIEINGMQCEHCQGKAEKALNAMEGVEAKVELKKKRAVVNLSKEVEDQAFKDTLSALDFQVVSIKEKKGLFS